MVPKLYKPLYPDEPGDDVTYIPGTGNRYAMTENGNTYRVNGQDILEDGQVPLKPERPIHRREHFRLRIRLKGDSAKPARPYHSVSFLMMKTFRSGDWPDYETGKWNITYKNGDARDCRLCNLEVTEGFPRKRRKRLASGEKEMARCLLRNAPKAQWQLTAIAQALNVKPKVLRQIETQLNTQRERKQRRGLRSK